MAYKSFDSQSIRDELAYILSNAKQQIVQNMDTHRRNASGRSVRDLRALVNETGTGFIGTIEYDEEVSWLYMEKGRGPNKTQKSKGQRSDPSFTGIIIRWILEKGIRVTPIPAKTARGLQDPYTRGLNTLAAKIARKIVKEGTALHRSGQRDDIFSSATENAANIAQNRLNAMFDAQIDRYLQL